MSEYSELLSLCRELKKLSLRDVEKACGVSKASICQAENDVHKLDFISTVKLCDFYGLTLDRLAGTIRKPTPTRSGENE